MIAAEELARLRVPLASLPGFDPVGLRVIHRTAWLADGIALETPVDGWVRIDGAEVSVEMADLDLADASTADRVARWVAGRVGLEVGCTAPEWSPIWAWGGGGWLLASGPWSRLFHGAAVRKQLAQTAVRLEVPGLVGVEGEAAGSRRLSDGSRYVDRLALALVAVHVGATP